MHADAHMNSVTHRSRARRATGAFTLIEIVLVVAILATLGGLTIASLGEAEAQSTANIAVHELSQVRQAVLRFREDTGFLPKQGLFDLESRGGRVRTVDFPGPETHTDHVQWFDAPENLWQLFECPLATTDPMAQPAAGRRGWRGPYLTRNAEARFRAFASTVPPVPAVADPFVHQIEAEWYSWSSSTERAISPSD
jgi:type II secretory pathway pseudopilin PulG